MSDAESDEARMVRKVTNKEDANTDIITLVRSATRDNPVQIGIHVQVVKGATLPNSEPRVHR
jgi:hypothetical protein